MSYEATVTSKGQITIPKAVRERMGLQQGEKLLFRFGTDGVRVVRVASDPTERLEAARERAAPLSVDVTKLIEREREQWT